jgi:hypothetical protein
LLIGTASCIGFGCLVTLPAAVTLIGRSLHTLTARAGAAQTSDALAVIALLIGFQAVWLRAWWRRHGGRVRGWRRRTCANTAEGR